MWQLEPGGAMQWQELKTIVDIVQGSVTVAAVFVGGAWSYRLFVRKRQPFPRARLEHQVSHYQRKDGAVLISVKVTVINTGETLLRLTEGETTIRQVLPLSARAQAAPIDLPPPLRSVTVGWSLLAREPEAWGDEPLEIEPGNRDELHYFFPLPAGSQVLLIRTFFANGRARDEGSGWNVTTVYDLHGCNLLRQTRSQEVHQCSSE
jgi:hypothetical protein